MQKRKQLQRKQIKKNNMFTSWTKKLKNLKEQLGLLNQHGLKAQHINSKVDMICTFISGFFIIEQKTI